VTAPSMTRFQLLPPTAPPTTSSASCSRVGRKKTLPPDAARARARRRSCSSRDRRPRTGRPGIHHVFARTIKDLFCRIAR
jgi:hypothetical protein